MTNREICLKAAQRLREVGWRQNKYGPEQGPHCMVGACRWAAGYFAAPLTATHAELDQAGHAASSAVANVVRPRRGAIAASFWNDAPGRTAEEVIAALEACP